MTALTSTQPATQSAAPPIDGPRESDIDLAIATTGLTKRFRSGQVAVDHVDLAVPRGAVYGFLGPNGSGKTTTIRMLLGLVRPTEGSVRLLGHDIPRECALALPHVGALVEGPAFHPYLSGHANLVRLDAMDETADPRSRGDRLDAALARVGLTNAAGKRYRQYSLGMKQRLGIAAALLQPRDLLVLDEPTNGLDPQGTREVRTLVRELARDGTTVLVSSHLLAEIEQVCSHVGIMSKGQLLRQGTIASLHEDEVAFVDVSTPAAEAATRVLVEMGIADVVTTERGDVRGTLGATPVEHVTSALVHAGIPVRGIAVIRPALEDLFVELTGEGFDVAR